MIRALLLCIALALAGCDPNGWSACYIVTVNAAETCTPVPEPPHPPYHPLPLRIGH